MHINIFQMNSSLNNNNSSNFYESGLKSNKKSLKYNNDNTVLSEIPVNSELSTQKIQKVVKTQKFSEKTKELENKANLYQTMFTESSLNSFVSKSSTGSLSMFDSNSNFSQKNLPFLKSPKSKVESIDNWACKESKFVGKIGLNSGLGRNFTDTFNDSALFISSN